MKRDTRHVPVLLDQVLQVLDLRPGQTVVDCTLGLGGHSAAMLERVAPSGRLIGIDFDPANIELARTRLKNVNGRFDLFHNNFAALPTVLNQAGVEKVDAILADLGVASPQIDDPDRGFSYRRPGPLDMRMDPTRGQPASALIARISERDLADALLELGDETDAPQIAHLIVERREIEPITTTQDLMAIVCEARDFTLKRAAGAKLHPAARTFQALRILVNRELANLDRLLAVLPECLNPGGIAAIISFHSGEDRKAKSAFRAGRDNGIFDSISPIRSSPIWLNRNRIPDHARRSCGGPSHLDGFKSPPLPLIFSPDCPDARYDGVEMTKLTLELPEDVRAQAEARAAAAGYASVDEYICGLIKSDEFEPIDSSDEAELARGMDSGPSIALTPELLHDIREKARRA